MLLYSGSSQCYTAISNYWLPRSSFFAITAGFVLSHFVLFLWFVKPSDIRLYPALFASFVSSCELAISSYNETLTMPGKNSPILALEHQQLSSKLSSVTNTLAEYQRRRQNQPLATAQLLELVSTSSAAVGKVFDGMLSDMQRCCWVLNAHFQ